MFSLPCLRDNRAASSFSTRILTTLFCLARSSARSPWQASQSGDGNTRTIIVSASWGCVLDVSELWPSARQKGGHWRCFGSAGGVEEAPLFHTPTSTTDILSVDTTIAQQVLSSMGRRREKDTSVLQLRAHTNQNEIKIQVPQASLPSSSPVCRATTPTGYLSSF